jgi:hypothetical protein
MPGEISITTLDSNKPQDWIRCRANCIYGLEGIFSCEEGYFIFHLNASESLILDDDRRAKSLLWRVAEVRQWFEWQNACTSDVQFWRSCWIVSRWRLRNSMVLTTILQPRYSARESRRTQGHRVRRFRGESQVYARDWSRCRV